MSRARRAPPERSHPRPGVSDNGRATRALLLALGLCGAGACRAPEEADQATKQALSQIQASQERILARLDALERRAPATADGVPRETGAPPPPRTAIAPPPRQTIGQTRGAAEPAVTIVEYLDFASPESAAAARWSADILAAHADRVAVEFRPFPGNRNPDARGAAKAAWAAAQQGKFWEMHDLLFANQSALGEDRLSGYAQQLGLDVARFEADRVSAAAEGAIVVSKQSGSWTGMRTVPAILVNGKLIEGASAETVRQEVEAALRAARAHEPS